VPQSREKDPEGFPVQFRDMLDSSPIGILYRCFLPKEFAGNTGLMMSKHHQAPAKLLISDVGWYLKLAAVSGFGSNLGEKTT
jgi:hypothetical protein